MVLPRHPSSYYREGRDGKRKEWVENREGGEGSRERWEGVERERGKR